MAETKLKLRQLQQDGASTNDYLKFDGSNWAPATFVGVDGSGSAGRVAYWSDADTLTSDAQLTYNDTTDVLTIDDLTIDGSNSTLYTTTGILQLKGTSAGTLGTILLSEVTGNAIVLSSGTSTANSGTVNRLVLNGAFSPTSGTGIHNWINVAPLVNQTGGANGVTAALHIEPTLTSAADFRGLELTYSNANAWGIYQSGALTKNYLQGNTGINTTSIAQTLHVQGTARITGSDGTPTTVMGRDADGDISSVTLGSTLSLSGGTLGVSTTGVVLIDGNTLGAQLTIGTNDANALALETNNVTRLSITGGASTGGAITITDVTANTNTVENVLTLRANSTGTAAASFGTGLLFQGESSTTDNRDMVRLASIWTTATDASRESALVYSDVTAAGALTERFRFTPASMTTATAYTVGNSSSALTLGGSTGTVTLSSSASSTTALALTTSGGSGTTTINSSTAGRGTTTAGLILQTTSFTPTAISTKSVEIQGGYAPTSSGTATHTSLSIAPTINQTGGHTGVTYGIRVNPTLTAAADFRSVEIAPSSASAWGIYQSGALTRNYFAGNVGINSTGDTATRLFISSTGTYTSDSYGTRYSGTATSATNNVDYYGVFTDITGSNDGTVTGNTVRGGNFGVATNSTFAGIVYGLGAGVTNTSPNSSQVYGFNARVDENSATGNLTSRYGMDFLLVKGAQDATDAHTGIGIRTRIQDSTSTGRWVSGTGLSIGIENAVTLRGAAVTCTNNKGTGSTQYGMEIANVASGAGVVVDNAYGLSLSHAENSSGSISNYYSIINSAVPVATTSYGLYFSGAGWRNFLNGSLCLGVNDNTAKFVVRGDGATSSTTTAKFEDSASTDILTIRDDGRVAIKNSSFSATLHVTGEGSTSATTSMIVEKADGTDILVVRNDGRVGILDATPAYPLDVAGEAAMRHIYSNTSAPSNSLGGSTIVGTGASAWVTGGDIGMNVSLTTGTGVSAAGTITTITFNVAYGTGPTAVAFPKNAATAAMFKNAELWLETSATTITVKSTNNLTSSTTYDFDIIVIGRIGA